MVWLAADDVGRPADTGPRGDVAESGPRHRPRHAWHHHVGHHRKAGFGSDLRRAADAGSGAVLAGALQYLMYMEIFTLHRGTAPLLVSLPHDGTALPDDMAERMTASARRVPDTDWHVSRLYAFGRELGASMIVPGH